MTNYTGTSGSDTYVGTASADTFDMAQAGNDSVSAGDGDDTISFGAFFTANDSVDGGAGTDTLTLNGYYYGAQGIPFGALTLTNVEKISLTGDFSYQFLLNAATVTAGQSLEIDGSGLVANHNTLDIDGSQVAGSLDIVAEVAGPVFLKGGSAGDLFRLGGNLVATDALDGGGGYNQVILAGDYSAGLTFGASTIKNIDRIDIFGGNDYLLVMNDANVAAGATLAVDGGSLTASDSLTFDGTAETDGQFFLQGGAGSDTLTGGAGDDMFKGLAGDDVIDGGAGKNRAAYSDAAGGVSVSLLLQGAAQDTGDGLDTLSNIQDLSGGAGNDALTGDGNDNWLWGEGGSNIVSGNGGNDLIEIGTETSGEAIGTDSLDGGSGINTLLFDDAGSVGVKFSLALQGSSQVTSVATVNAVNFQNVGGTAFKDILTGDGANNILYGGGGNDTLVGGAGNDTLYGDKLLAPTLSLYEGPAAVVDASPGGKDKLEGGLGRDMLNGGVGADQFVYTAATDSTGKTYDIVDGANFAADIWDVPGTVGGIDAIIAVGALSKASFNADLAVSVDAAHLAAGHAVLFTPDSGTLSGKTFLVIDLNGVAGYQANDDLVVNLVHPHNLASLDIADFI